MTTVEQPCPDCGSRGPGHKEQCRGWTDEETREWGPLIDRAAMRSEAASAETLTLDKAKGGAPTPGSKQKTRRGKATPRRERLSNAKAAAA